jgi:hypothetical protein
MWKFLRRYKSYKITGGRKVEQHYLTTGIFNNTKALAKTDFKKILS